MTRIGYHASHEQIDPRRLLAHVQRAEAAGFELAMCSDHISPWSSRQGHSGFAWSWLGAALATTALDLGVVTVPGYRYPPAVLAHASATLAFMYPGRFWCALGSGENLNEKVTAQGWPDKAVRQQRLAESFEIIRRLHDGEQVTHNGAVAVDRAQLWDLPDERPPLILPALTAQTAAELATVADGLITVNQSLEDLTGLLRAYRAAGGAGPTMLQVHLSWAPTEQEARDVAWDQWRTNVFEPRLMGDLATVPDYEHEAESVTFDMVADSVNVSADVDQHVTWLKQYAELGFDRLYLHHVGQTQQGFIDVFAREVLPQFR